MKKLILFVLVLLAGNVRGQGLPCSVLPPEFQAWCSNFAWLDTLDLINDTNIIAIDTSNSCELWQIGHSYKPFFDSISSPLGLVTDTLLPYNENIKCSFLLKQPNVSYVPTILFFEHKYETDWLSDGGYIEYSCNQGQTWRLMSFEDSVPPFSINFYNVDFSLLQDSIPSFTGTNNDWQWSGIQIVWQIAIMKPEVNRWQECYDLIDTLYYRFTFESDSINSNKAGWMIRNIVLGSNDLDMWSVPEFSTHSLKLFPNPASEKIVIDCGMRIEKCELKIRNSLGQIVQQSAINNPQSEIDISSLSPGIYFVLAETEKYVFRQKLVKQ